jgi:DNA-binding CsgD family transcriptional regulator
MPAIFTARPLQGIVALRTVTGRPLSAGHGVEHENHEHLRVILVVALMSIIVGGSIDLMMDQPESWLSFHVVFETLMIAGALVMATTLWLGWWRSAQSVDELRRYLDARSEERDAWRSSAEHALAGLSRAIDRQFDAWDLTPAEREIALLLLKGHSHKAIAKHTERSVQTVRQHAAVVYRKAKLSGRAELAAFFLADLMLPERERDAK